MILLNRFLQIRLRSLRTQIRTNLRPRWLEYSLSCGIVCGLVIGGYYLSLRAFRFLVNQEEIGELLLDRTFHLGWSIILYLLIISNLITAFSTIYRSPEASFLFALPIKHRDIFRIKFFDNLFYSSWGIVILGLPLTMAYGRIRAINSAETIAVFILALPPYLIIATALALTFMLLAVFLSKWFRFRSIFLLSGGLLVSLVWIYFRYTQTDSIIIGDTASFHVISRYLFNLSITPFPLLPSYWFSQLFALRPFHNWSDFILYGGLLISTALVCLEGIGFISGKLYFRTYQLMEHSRRNKTQPDSRIELFKRLQWIPSQIRGLVTKDVLQFVRTPQQWAHFLLFGFFISVYLVNLTRIRIYLAFLNPFWQTAIFIMNFGFSGFILAALTARFVFPLISLEGPCLWMLRSSPLKMKKLFQEKFWLSFLVFFLVAEMIALATNHYLGQVLLLRGIITFFLLLMSLALVSIALGLGGVYPHFKERNPMRISAGMGGIVTIAISLFYVTMMALFLVWMMTAVQEGSAGFPPVLILGGVMLANLPFIYLPLKLGYLSVLKTEA